MVTLDKNWENKHAISFC